MFHIIPVERKLILLLAIWVRYYVHTVLLDRLCSAAVSDGLGAAGSRPGTDSGSTIPTTASVATRPDGDEAYGAA